MKRDRVIKFRATEEEERRLLALSQLTGENSSEIMRQLIRSAQLGHRPTVQAGSIKQRMTKGVESCISVKN